MNFNGNDILIATVKDRPWVAVQPICDHLGISAAQQTKRLLRHHEQSGLEVALINYQGTRLLCIRMEEIHWWLRTLRPRTDVARSRLEVYRDEASLFWAILHHWVDLMGRYCTTRELRDKLVTPRDKYTPTPPKRSGGVTKQMADEWRVMRQLGHTYTEIAKQTGYSKTTICQVVNGKYPARLTEKKRA